MALVKVLLAEDDAATAQMYRLALEIEGWDVHVAGDGQAAVDAALADPPSVVLLDIDMPKLNGIQVLELLRNHDQTASTPVIVLSNSPGSQSMIEAYALGLSAWAVKAKTSPQALVTLVRGYLAL